MSVENRPWGKYEVLYDGEDCKVKKITQTLIKNYRINIITKEQKFGLL